MAVVPWDCVTGVSLSKSPGRGQRRAAFDDRVGIDRAATLAYSVPPAQPEGHPPMTTPCGLLTFCLLALAQPPVPPPAAPVPPKTVPQPKSPAELIADTRASIKQGEQVVAKLQKELDSPDGEYKSAEADFEDLNQKLKDAKTKAMKLTAEGKAVAAKAVEEQIGVIDKDWKLARERFDIAIQKRQTRREAVDNLKERVVADRVRLAELEGKTPAVEPPKPMPPTVIPPVAPNPRPVTPPATPEGGTPKPPNEAPKPAAPPAEAPKPVLPTLPGMPPVAATAPATPDQTPLADTPAVREIRDRLAQLRAAQATAEARRKVAQERVAMQERFQQMADKSQKLDREALEQAKKAIERADEILTAQPPPSAEEWQRAEKSRNDATSRAVEIKERLDRVADRIITLREKTDEYKAEEVAAAAAVDKAKAVADAADAELTGELNPTSVRNVTKWVLDRGPRILMIVAVTLLIHLVVRQFSRQFVRLAARNSRRGSDADRENRLETLIGVFRYVAGILIFGSGIVSLLDVVGVPVGTIIGGAAVIGLAVAFGAQNLIRDYFTGFIMLLEDQYSVNDVVRIGTLAGLVEHISLRMTVLRDLEGVRHFIPHGGITGVSNLTHTWSRALFDVSVAYKENVDVVMRELLQLGRDMRADPTFGRDILEDPEMLGVDALGDSGVIIKFLMKTRPLQQWPIKREMLRRIKNRFDELGIEIPFPHRTVYHRMDQGDVGAKLLHGLSAHRAA